MYSIFTHIYLLIYHKSQAFIWTGIYIPVPWMQRDMDILPEIAMKPPLLIGWIGENFQCLWDDSVTLTALDGREFYSPGNVGAPQKLRGFS